MTSTELPSIIDLHLNPKAAPNDNFYFRRSLQAPLSTAEVARLAAPLPNVEGRRDGCDRQRNTGVSTAAGG